MAKRFIEKALKDHPSMSCRIRIYEDGTIELVSYTTMVLRAVRRDPDTREYWVEAHGTFWDNERVFTPPLRQDIFRISSESISPTCRIIRSSMRQKRLEKFLRQH